MATVIEKKVKYLGTWRENTLADNIIKTMAQRVRENKGEKVKIRLTKDGLSLTKHFLLVGTSMTDYIRFRNIYFMTVNQYHQHCLLVIAKNQKTKYQILAFKCDNGLDVGMIVSAFKDMRRALNKDENVNYELQKPDGLNWTLREKREGVADKRQLSNMVDIHVKGEVQRNGGIPKHETNGYEHRDTGVVSAYISHSPAREYNPSPPSPKRSSEVVVTREVYTHNGDRQNVSVQAESDHQNADGVSHSSEASLRDELDTLSHELRDIKFMLEKSTGIGAEEYVQKSPRTSQSQDTDPIDAVVVYGDEKSTTDKVTVVSTHISNGKHDSPRMEGEVSVQVPDYRSLGTQTFYAHKTYPHTRTSEVHTTNYNEWKGETLRAQPHNTRIYREEIRHRVAPRSSRPRSHYYSTSSYGSGINGSVSGSLRSSSKGLVIVDQAPHHRVHTTRRLNTTVQKPIEKVYTRPHSVHGSVHKTQVVAEKVPLYYTTEVTDHNQNDLGSSGQYSPTDAVVIKY